MVEPLLHKHKKTLFREPNFSVPYVTKAILF
jgi:hypothetical protein